MNASGANSSSSLVLLDSSVKADVDVAAKLDLFGISYVFFYQSANTTEVYQNIVLGGTVLHESSNATKLVTRMQERMASIESSVGSPASKAKVVFMDYYGSNSGYPSNVVGNDSFINDIITVAGGINAFGNETGYQDVSGEAVVAADPDYIIVSSSMNGQDSQAVYDQIMNDTVLSLTPAVLHQHVYVIHDQMEDCFLQNGIREVDGAQILAEISVSVGVQQRDRPPCPGRRIPELPAVQLEHRLHCRPTWSWRRPLPGDLGLERFCDRAGQDQAVC